VSPVATALLVVLVLGAGVALYAFLAPRRRAQRQTSAPERSPLQVETEWNDATAQEFATLTEPARCDMIFAVAALDDRRSAQLLEFALGDPSEAVAVAAARALTARGRSGAVDAYLERHPGERAERIAHTLALLAPEP
jgi:hypothetical protein